VFDSYGSRGWEQFGGTSAGTPQWAALVAIVNQGRAVAGKSPLANAQAALYAMPSADFHDIVDGSNHQFYATPGYDLASGLGSPIADKLIPDLVAFNGATDFTIEALPVAAPSKKSNHHFSSGVDAAIVPIASLSLGSRGRGLRSLLASSLDAANADTKVIALVGTPLAPVDADFTSTSSCASSPAGTKARTASAMHERKSRTTPATDAAKGVDAFFEGLGEGVTVA
jgi:hypothetical protein